MREIYNYFLQEIFFFSLSLDLLNGLSWCFYLLFEMYAVSYSALASTCETSEVISSKMSVGLV